MTLEIGMVIQIVLYALALAGLWYTLQNRVNIIKQCMDSLEEKHDKEHILVNGKIDETNQDIKDLKSEIREDKNHIIEKIDGIKSEMNKNHIKILEAINNK